MVAQNLGRFGFFAASFLCIDESRFSTLCRLKQYRYATVQKNFTLTGNRKNIDPTLGHREISHYYYYLHERMRGIVINTT